MAQKTAHDPVKPLTIADHLKEIKNRLFFVVLVLLISSSLVYMYREFIIPIILQPYKTAFGEERLMYLNPAGGFNFIFFISIYVGLAVTFPIIVQQLYLFVRPMLPLNKRRIAGRLLLASSALLVVGVLFGYFVAIPGALGFLKEFATDYVTASLTADSYIHFLISYTVGLGVLFQFPLLLILIDFIKPLTPLQLLKSERWVILLCTIAAAVITPTPDPLNMIVVAGPLIGMYQIGVAYVLLKYAYSKRSRRMRATAEPERISLLDVEHLPPQEHSAINAAPSAPLSISSSKPAQATAITHHAPQPAPLQTKPIDVVHPNRRQVARYRASRPEQTRVLRSGTSGRGLLQPTKQTLQRRERSLADRKNVPNQRRYVDGVMPLAASNLPSSS